MPPPTSAHITKLANAYAELARLEMSRNRDSADCSIRAALDHVAAKVVGMAVSRLHDIRRRIAAEPSVAGWQRNRLMG